MFAMTQWTLRQRRQRETLRVRNVSSYGLCRKRNVCGSHHFLAVIATISNGSYVYIFLIFVICVQLRWYDHLSDLPVYISFENATIRTKLYFIFPTNYWLVRLPMNWCVYSMVALHSGEDLYPHHCISFI